TSVFGYDDKISSYLHATGRGIVADLAEEMRSHLRSDPEVYQHPEKYFDQLIEIDLSALEPHINGPYTPDAAYPISEFCKIAVEKGFPEKIDVGLIGSCTNSSYEDLTRAASVARQALDKGLRVQSEFMVTPGSEQIRYTTERDGLLKVFEDIGGVVMSNACGPCIGQWKRHTEDPDRKNSIINSFNRNFAKRNDGNPNTHSFVASPEIVTAMSIAGKLTFNPLEDSLINEKGEPVKLDEPEGIELPPAGFDVKDPGFIAPVSGMEDLEVIIRSGSERLQALEPFPPFDRNDLRGLRLLIKVRGKCTTDHISMAGPWLRFRGHLDNISGNLMMGAVNEFNGQTNLVKNQVTGMYDRVSTVARHYKTNQIESIIVGDENYGEGSSREHAAMEPRHLNVRVVLVKSFARIHETNLKKQGMLALTFADKKDYERIREDDRIDILGLSDIEQGKSLTVVLNHADGTTEEFAVHHSYNPMQISWFRAGSALNLIRIMQK
ncbi:MAG TPA: aconitase family protein, partial [Bacteroidales bacterium]|nr:aconitase family protein [Bacteroidales bacterium]